MAADKYILASKFAEELDTIPVELKRIGHTYKHQKLISLDSAIDLLVEAPAEDVRPVARGHWLWTALTRTCSVCGQMRATGRMDNFCPSCGADMRMED